MSNAPITGFIFIGAISLVAVLAPVFLFLFRNRREITRLIGVLWVSVLLIPFYFALYIVVRETIEGISVSLWSLVAMIIQVYIIEIFFMPIASGRIPSLGLLWIVSIAFAYVITMSYLARVERLARIVGVKRTLDASNRFYLI